MKKSTHEIQRGFTIVELLVVIVVIGILASIVIVAYNGVKSQATAVSIKSDLRHTHDTIQLENITGGSLPTDSSTFKASNGGVYQYTHDDVTKTYCLTETIGTQSFHITEVGKIENGACPGHTTSTFTSMTWSSKSVTGSLRSIAMSGDGTKMYTAGTSTPIYVSSDSGATWTSRASTQSWYSLASSTDGLTAYGVTATGSGQVWRTINGGTTWTATSAPAKDYRSVSMSGNGSVIVASPYNGYPSVSTDGGTTWTDRNTAAGSRIILSSATSRDGSTLYLNTSSNKVYRSTDAGLTWTQLNAFGAQQQIATSENGQRLVGVSYGTVTVSNDFGATLSTYTAPTGGQTWTGLAMSSDGLKVIGGRYTEGIYTSTNGGETWTTQNSAGNGNWQGAAMSTNGVTTAISNYSSSVSLGIYN